MLPIPQIQQISIDLEAYVKYREELAKNMAQRDVLTKEIEDLKAQLLSLNSLNISIQ